MKKFYEPTISVEKIYSGRIIDLQLEKVQLPNGKEALREVVRHPGAVAILPFTDDNRCIMVEQFRKPLDRSIIEIPAGKLERGEDPDQCAIRELEEETGYRAERMEYLFSYYTSPGFADEIMHFYIAWNCIPGESRLDDDEFLSIRTITLSEAQQLIREREIIDAKTIMAILYWQNLARNDSSR